MANALKAAQLEEEWRNRRREEGVGTEEGWVEEDQKRGSKNGNEEKQIKRKTRREREWTCQRKRLLKDRVMD